MTRKVLPAFMSASSIRWLLAETLVVVLGILIAFQVEEYRTGRINHSAELKAVHALMEDLKADSLQLAEFKSRTIDQSEAFVRLSLHFDGRGGLAADSLLHFIRQASYGRIWTPATAAFESIRDSGKLDLISDSELRSQISNYFSGWNSYFKSLADDYGKAVDAFLASGNADVVMVPDVGNDGIRYRRTLARPMAEIPTNPEFRALLGRSGNFSRFLLTRIDRAEELRVELLTSLEQHLGEL